ncbi:hypothetical protein RclHR1_00100041 [Rhizophagus clarus]|uniref:Protein kinase domain-containing protein n=1 Tax=Rhizophagus clarus TaxID=94130 RepID=A0A2Z6Q0M3_9GLOM|nr:hypothetical protein RclHR1_00100041 [Rhizophagus clarus]
MDTDWYFTKYNTEITTTRKEVIHAALYRAFTLTDYAIKLNEQHQFRKKIILDDKTLTKDEKSVTIKRLEEGYDYLKILFNEGTKRLCENCEKECLATFYCEYCIQNYLKEDFPNWSSGNDNIDILIRKCQEKTFFPVLVVEWISYNHLHNVRYLTKGGCSEIYVAEWAKGRYIKWDTKEKKLVRSGKHKVILKKLENIESANRSWFEEATLHLNICIKWIEVALCYGITRNPLNDAHFLVMSLLDMDLRKYLQQNFKELTWKEKILITIKIIDALNSIHNENVVHRDLHSGNVLYSQYNNYWYISDLGFCGPINKPPGSIYGNLPYMAPEVIIGKGFTFASDIYSVSMLMWEISTGRSPFYFNRHKDYDLAMNIVNGMRPKIPLDVPLEYKNLMIQCWDADPGKRPNVSTLLRKMREISTTFYQNEESGKQINNNKILNNVQLNTSSSISSSTTNSLVENFNSKIYNFKILSEPRNATEEEQEAYQTITSKQAPESELKNSLKLIVNCDYNEVIVRYIQRSYIGDDHNDYEAYNFANLHSKEQEELEIPEF